MNLDEFIANIKQLSGYGNPSSASDQAAKNIVIAINDSLKIITKNWLWDWLHKDITITLVPGTSDYTLDSDVSKIVAIGTGYNDYLRHVSAKEYLLWHKASTTYGQSDVGSPGVYMYIGRDATTGARKIRIDDIPSATSTLTGFAKKRLTVFEASDLDTSKTFLPFPIVDGSDILKEFVMAQVYRIQGKSEGVYLAQDAKAQRRLAVWRGESQTDPAADVTSPPPTYYRNKKASRRNGYTV
jgi:hypothetical protein